MKGLTRTDTENLELSSRNILFPNSEGNDGGSVSVIEIFPARHHQLVCPPQLPLVQLGEAGLEKESLGALHQMEWSWCGVNEGDKVSGTGVHPQE